MIELGLAIARLLIGLIRLVGLSIGVIRSPHDHHPQTYLKALCRSPSGFLGCVGLLSLELVAFALSAGSDEGLRQVSGLLGGLWVMFFNPHPQLSIR